MSCLRAHGAHCAARSAESSFSWMPPKPPLLMQTMWSPGPRRPSTCATSVVDGCRARWPARPSVRARRPRPSPARRCGRTTGRLLPGSRASCAAMVPSFMVLLRGSNTARMRSRCFRWRRAGAQAVERGADGGRDGGRSRRRRVIRRPARDSAAQLHAAPHVLESLPSAAAASAGDTPTCSAAAIAASAFIWLCSPESPHSTRPTRRPRCSTSNASCGRRRLASRHPAPKRAVSLQQPWRQHPLQAFFRPR